MVFLLHVNYFEIVCLYLSSNFMRITEDRMGACGLRRESLHMFFPCLFRIWKTLDPPVFLSSPDTHLWIGLIRFCFVNEGESIYSNYIYQTWTENLANSFGSWNSKNCYNYSLLSQYRYYQNNIIGIDVILHELFTDPYVITLY